MLNSLLKYKDGEKKMNYKIKNQKLEDGIRKAETSEGYFILITKLNNSRLHHSYFTLKFPRGDISTSLEKFGEMLQNEMGPTSFRKKFERRLPPEYQKAENK